MATILNIETATTNCSVSVSHYGKLIALKEHDTPSYSHSEQLHLFVDEVIKEAKLSLDDIDAVAVSKGPGSYTGLRIGVSAAKGLCFALDVPLISIATLESMAQQCVANEVDFVIPLLDARRMEVYSEVYDNNLKLLRKTEAEIIASDSFKEYASKG
ncbi:tRNA (adenosine(37)-N6)-threonylcarbamoyltransferase complex dimerization subunit type 1 TsaB, partial [Aurantibacter sp.]|uniref:tRNA (adenosine(37)-N6)-threonylcarbamoyltransferase complex dimerization subunit type 1 TsaB n=1 Tax=Aurantibacter sp. TaxID=2807103 RepID=UPI0032659BCE